jgi:hypothetical protein
LLLPFFGKERESSFPLGFIGYYFLYQQAEAFARFERYPSAGVKNPVHRVPGSFLPPIQLRTMFSFNTSAHTN